MIDIFKELIEFLPQIIKYLVVGYFFIHTFHFVALKQNSDNIEHILTGSFVIGYVYYNICAILPFSINPILDDIGILLSGIIIAYLFGKCVTGTKIIPILDKLKIRDTFNKYLWDDLLDQTYSMKAIVNIDNCFYSGYIHYTESYTNTPHIALCLYTCKDNQGNIISDCSDDYTKVIVLDTSKAKSVEILYDVNSPIVKDIRSFKR